MDAPVAGAGEVVVDVERAGLCGTDIEFFSGEMSYLSPARRATRARSDRAKVGVRGFAGTRLRALRTYRPKGMMPRDLAGDQHSTLGIQRGS